jgi:hypothetical protein
MAISLHSSSTLSGTTRTVRVTVTLTRQRGGAKGLCTSASRCTEMAAVIEHKQANPPAYCTPPFRSGEYPMADPGPPGLGPQSHPTRLRSFARRVQPAVFSRALY